jgi:hypothetical protein
VYDEEKDFIGLIGPFRDRRTLCRRNAFSAFCGEGADLSAAIRGRNQPED